MSDALLRIREARIREFGPGSRVSGGPEESSQYSA
jgi:hypothetical protein